MLIREKKTFAVEYEGKVIGSLGIELYDEKQIPELHDFKGRELSFVLAKDYWAKA
jgi:ribosomal-protein-alanine N-acetyltransferase